MCYRAIAQLKTQGVAVLCVLKNEETFARRSAKFRDPLVLTKEHAVRLLWTMTTVSTTAILVCY